MTTPGDSGPTQATVGASSPVERDLRADFFRGTALLLILWNHVFWAADAPIPFFLEFTPIHWGLASAAEVFVFLSGYVYGLVYVRVAESHGNIAAFEKSFLRAWQLYVANLVTMLLTLAIVGVWATTGPGVPDDAARRLQLQPFLDPTPGLFSDLARLHVVPWAFDVLALYIVLLLLAPIYLALIRKHVLWVVPVAGLLYGLAQLGVNLPSAHTDMGEWYFNPFAWQAVFLLGLLVGVRGWSIARHRWLVRGSGVVVAVIAVKVWLVPRLLWRIPDLAAWRGGFLADPVPLTDVTALEPVRLLYFVILAYFVAALVRREAPWLRTAAARPVVLLGQLSLEAFCFGLVYTYLAAAVLLSFDRGWPVTATVTAIGGILSIGFAALLRGRRSLPWAKRGEGL